MLEAGMACVESERCDRFAARFPCVLKQAEPLVSAVADRRCPGRALATVSSKLDSQLNAKYTWLLTKTRLILKVSQWHLVHHKDD
jgi:hypothetical protein